MYRHRREQADTLRDGIIQCIEPSISNPVRNTGAAGLPCHQRPGRAADRERRRKACRAACSMPTAPAIRSARFCSSPQRAERSEVDIETGAVRIISLAGAHDVGRAINPLIIEGQIEGGLVQGLGYALLEDVPQVDGRPVYTRP